MTEVIVENTKIKVTDMLWVSAKNVKSRKYPCLKLTTEDKI